MTTEQPESNVVVLFGSHLIPVCFTMNSLLTIIIILDLGLGWFYGTSTLLF